MKLIPNIGNKTNYGLHHTNLQLHLSLGIKLTKIHRVLKFKQSDWMKIYIDFNTEKRTNAALKKMVSMSKRWKVYEKESMSD